MYHQRNLIDTDCCPLTLLAADFHALTLAVRGKVREYTARKAGCGLKHNASFSGGKDSTAMVLRLVEENYPLDEIVFFDTGWEFPAMYDHIRQVEEYIGRKVTFLRPNKPFDYMLLSHPVVARAGPMKGKIHRIGHGWPSMQRRWCTRLKCNALDKHDKGAVRYVGYAADEATRTMSANLKKLKQYPLVEWDMSEADCLRYCRDRGFTWSGLYELFSRVSCYCCPLQRIGELRTLRREFPELWEKMLLQDRLMGKHNKGFMGYKSVQDMDRRFAEEDRQRMFFPAGHQWIVKTEGLNT